MRRRECIRINSNRCYLLVANLERPMADDTAAVPPLRGMTEDQAVETMLEWFGSTYEDPANLPYITAEGGTQWIEGGPYYASDELTVFIDELAQAFGEKSVDRLIARAAEEVEADGQFEWAKKRGRDWYDGDVELLATEDGSLLVTEKGEAISVGRRQPLDTTGMRSILVGRTPTESIDEIIRWFHREFAPAPEEDLGQAYRGWAFYDGGIPTMQALKDMSEALETKFDAVRAMIIMGDAAEVIERESGGVTRWIPTTVLTKDSSQASTTSPASENEARERAARAIEALARTMARLQPPSPSIGHNNPPEPIEAGPWDWDDWTEIEAAVADAKRQIENPATSGGAVRRAASVLTEKAGKFANWIKLATGLAGGALLCGYFNEAGAALYRQTEAAAQALREWSAFF